MSSIDPLHRRLFGPRAERIVDAGRLLREHARPTDLEGTRLADAAIWNEATEGPVDTRIASAIRRLLTPRGRVAVFRPVPASRDPRVTLQSLILHLSEAGFVILDEDAAPGFGADPVARGVWVLARAARYRIRGYAPGDESAIGALFQDSFHVARAVDAWRWKFEQHPWRSETPPIALAWDEAAPGDPRLVGQYAAVPMRLASVNDPDDRALQLCDIMTAPEARTVGRGPTAVLSRMLRRLYASHAEHRIGFVIGWNTATSRAFALRFHHGNELESVADWHRDATSPTFEAHADRNSGDDYEIRVIERFDERFDRFFERVLPAYGYLQHRDARYLDWRYRQPGVRYLPFAAYRGEHLVGWSVFRRHEDQLEWGDALFDPDAPEAVGAVLQRALDHPMHQGVTQITGWFSERPAWWRDQLLALGFARRPEPNDLSLIYGVHSRPDAGQRLARLYYTKGDSDLF